VGSKLKRCRRTRSRSRSKGSGLQYGDGCCCPGNGTWVECTRRFRWRWAGQTPTCTSSRSPALVTGHQTPASDTAVQRESLARLYEVAGAPRARINYLYDFGDSWEHDLLVEQLDDPRTQAHCLAGRRACPPEDCGGPWGYATMLDAVADVDHPDHEEHVEWVGEAFDPEAFDCEATDAAISRL
jgi:hypothetical protein